jgi:hypothetical protein
VTATVNHLVMDNYAAPKHPAIKAWLTPNPHIRMHFTPITPMSASWLNLVEVWFSTTIGRCSVPDRVLTRHLVRRLRLVSFVGDSGRQHSGDLIGAVAVVAPSHRIVGPEVDARPGTGMYLDLADTSALSCARASVRVQ